MAMISKIFAVFLIHELFYKPYLYIVHEKWYRSLNTENSFSLLLKYDWYIILKA